MANMPNRLATKLAKLPGADAQGEWDPDTSTGADAAANQADAAATAGLAARVRLMMLISGLTTLIAIAAVIGVIGYRIYHAGSSGAAPTEAIVMLPKAARVVSTAVAGDRIVVTIEVGGSMEVRTFDAKTLKETGRVRFATEAVIP
jgi:hypothetical protein